VYQQWILRLIQSQSQQCSNTQKHPKEWEKYKLSDEQVNFFKENGYLTGVRILTEEQCDLLLKELPDTIDPNNPGHKYFYEFNQNESKNPSTTLFHALGAWRINKFYHDILWAPAFRMAAYQLLGGDVRFFHDQLFCKPAKHGGVVAWHKDYSYWTWTKPMQHLTSWIPLDNSTLENGCLWYVPKSHTWGLLPITGLGGDMEAVKTVLDDTQKEVFAKKVPMLLKRGECSFHHPLLMHGSYNNTSDAPRRATVINVFKEGTLSNAKVCLEGIPEADSRKSFLKFGGEGWDWVDQDKEMNNKFFPILFDGKKELKL